MKLSAKHKLGIILVSTSIFMLVEFFGSIYAKSLALRADATHMLSDMLGLAMSFFAMFIVEKPPSKTTTYGYAKVESLAALLNGLFLACMSIYIAHEALGRLTCHGSINAVIMIATAICGFMMNLMSATLLHDDSKNNLNVKGALIHVLGDMIGSIGSVIAGTLILLKGWYIADPLVSLFISLLILRSAYSLIRMSVRILLDVVPENIDLDKVRNTLLEIPHIEDIHDLHVWSVSSSKLALSVHVVSNVSDNTELLVDINNTLKASFNVFHIVIQFETSKFFTNNCMYNTANNEF